MSLYLQYLLVMKLPLLAPLFINLVSAIAVSRKANYDGYQVVRLQVGGNLDRVNNLIKDLSLSTWNGGPKEDSTVDVVVPAAVVDTFEDKVAGECFRRSNPTCRIPQTQLEYIVIS